MVDLGLWYDFRNPDWSRSSLPSIYAQTLEQAAFAESLGFDHIWTTEHHFVDDGYSPSLLPICAAIAARTHRIRIGTAVLLLLLHHPLRVAEDAATVDLLSNGRLDLGVGLGYRATEFGAFDVHAGPRGRRFTEAIALIRSCWHDAALSFHGEFWSYDGLPVTPKPVQPTIPLWIGGLTRTAVARAARIADGFLAGAGEDLIPAFVSLRLANGLPPAPVWASVGFTCVAEDPDPVWPLVAPAILHQRRIYAEWLRQAGTPIWDTPRSVDELRTTAPDLVVTPTRALRLIQERLGTQPAITHLSWAPLPPGLPPVMAAESLGLFASTVMPVLRGPSRDNVSTLREQ